MIGHSDTARLRHAPIKIDGGQRPANVRDGEFLREAHHGAKDTGEQVRVLVRIEMGGPDAGGYDLLNLSAQFRVGVEPLKKETYRSFRKRAAIENSAAIDEHKMAAYIERGRFARQADSVFEGVAIGHQRGRCENPFAVRLNYPGVHVARETEIVGVDDEALQR